MKSISQSRPSLAADPVTRSLNHRPAGLTWHQSPAEGLPPSAGVKRAMDLGLATLLIILTLPILLVSMAAIALIDGAFPLFRQPRVGLRGEEFLILKLRTMGNGSRPPVLGNRIFEKPRNDERVTPLGSVLRKLSVDELPQLFNVLRGDMSLVGPRPLLLRDMDRFPPGKPMRRFEVKPGITGLWQVSGRSLLSDEERIRLDIEYAERWNLWMDMAILLRTPMAVITGRGAF